ncbi:MAG: leucine-rich repeat protein [Lachnospiraceae bacterium]|nr:leucine-rich repeat protein [Lachnospiraceae bacterium]
MKKYYKIIAAIMTIVMLSTSGLIESLLALNIVSYAGETENGLSYTINEDEVTITGYNNSSESVVIPATIEGKNVAYINSNAFYECIRIKSITLPEGIKTIGSNAFYNCKSLKSVTFPSTLTSIGNYAFYNTLIETIDIPKSVTSIDNYAIRYNKKLTAINVAEDNEVYSSVDGVLYNKAHTSIISYPAAKKKVTIAEGVTSIDYNAFSETEVEDITFPQTLESIAYSAFYNCVNIKNINLPKSVNNIEQFAFSNCYNLESITVDSENEIFISYEGVLYKKDLSEIVCVPKRKTSVKLIEGLKSISYASFSGTDISEIIFPTSIETIGNNAFSNCSKLKSIVLPEGITSIGSSAFYASAIESIKLPSTLTQIQEEAFENCKNLKTIEIPDSVTSIGTRAFEYCYALESVKLSANINSISEGCFYNCTALKKITIPAGVTSIDRYAFYGCNNLKEVVLPNTLTGIRYEAFYECYALEKIDLPESLTYIDNYAFISCKTLTNVTIPKNVISIGESVFNGCSSLESFTVDSNNGYYASVDGILYNKEITEIISCPQNKSEIKIPDTVTSLNRQLNSCKFEKIEIPDTLTNLGDYAFSSCSSLKEIKIPDGITTIKQYTFDGCSSLTKVTLPSGLKRIERGAFDDCRALESIVIPEGTEYIGENAFSYTGLKEITFPESLLYIGGYAFNYAKLTTVTIPKNVTTIGTKAFDDCEMLTEINVDANNEYYASRDGVLYDKSFIYLQEVPCNKKEVKVETPTQIIRKNAFYGSKAKTIELPDSLTTIGEQAFSYCRNVKEIVLPNSVTAIGDYAFQGCEKLEKITLPENLVDTGKSSFSYCEKLKEVVFNNKLEIIGYDAFYGCESLVTISIPKSVKNIRDRAFDSCLSLESIQVDNDNEYYTSVDGVLYNKDKKMIITCPCKKTSIQLPEGLTTIKEYAFYHCEDLKKIDIPNTVNTIENYAFYYSGIEELNIPEGVNKLDYGTFYGCNNLVKVTIPASVENIYTSGMENCEKLEEIKVADNNAVYSSVDGVLYKNNNSQLLICPAAKKELKIPKETTYIYDNALYYSKDLAKIDVDEENIEYASIDGVLYNKSVTQIVVCPNGKKELTIPKTVNNVSNICKGSFISNSSLESIKVDGDNEKFTSVNGVLFSKDKKILMLYPPKAAENYEIPNGTEIISGYAFYNISSISFPETLKTIEYYAFYNCRKLMEDVVHLPKSLSSIRDYSFSNDSNLVYECDTEEQADTIKNIVRGEVVVKGKYITLPVSMGTYKITNEDTVLLKPEDNAVYRIETTESESSEKLETIRLLKGTTGIGVLRLPDKSKKYDIEITGTYTNFVENGTGVLITGKGKSDVAMYVMPNRNTDAITYEEGITEIEDPLYLLPELKSVYIPNSVVRIHEDAFGDDADFKNQVTIYGVKGSYAETYANEHGIKFVNKSSANESNYNVEVIGVDSGVTIDVKLVDNSNAGDIELEENQHVGAVYDITLSKESESYQPGTQVEVKIPFKKNVKSVKVYRINDDKTYELLPSIYDGEYVRFVTDHFSKYVLVVDDVSYGKGDINLDGKTDIADALLAARFDAELVILNDNQIKLGDVTGDGKVTVADALKIARYDAGLVESLE